MTECKRFRKRGGGNSGYVVMNALRIILSCPKTFISVPYPLILHWYVHLTVMEGLASSSNSES